MPGLEIYKIKLKTAADKTFSRLAHKSALGIISAVIYLSVPFLLKVVEHKSHSQCNASAFGHGEPHIRIIIGAEGFSSVYTAV